MNYNPLVSIVIPAYKASNYLAEAIDCALSQTYKNIEVIVVNDGSPDDGATEKIALSYGDKIRYFNKENGGSSSALNTGIKNMKGEWFSWLSHDDLYYPEKIEKQIDCINNLNMQEEDLKQYVFFTGANLIDANGKIIATCKEKDMLMLEDFLQNLKGNEYLIAEPTRFIFHGCGCLVHKSVFETIGLFDEKLRIVNDADMWFRVYSNNYKIRFIPEALVKGRVHAKQVSVTIGYSYHNPEQDMYWNRSLEWLENNHSDNYELFYLYGKNAYSKTRYVEGNKAFEIAKKIKPSKKLFLCIKKRQLIIKSKIRSLMKKIYLKFKL